MLKPTDLVLVGVVTAPRDLELARVLGWYRLPARSAPRILNVDWLALYQTSAFGQERWSIRYLAPVRGHELTTRGALLQAEPNHPRAREPYFKLQLGPMECLARPIPACRWRRLAFLYTTGERLMAAADVRELVIDPAERAVLWQALRERRAGALVGGSPVREDEELDADLLAALGQVLILDGHGCDET